MNKEIDPNKAASDARAERLDSWVKDHYRTKQEFIDKFGLNQGEITNIISKKRVIGERKARKLESQTDIPDMYLEGIVFSKGDYVLESEYPEKNRYPRFIEISKKIDELKKEKKLSDAELLAIDIVINNALQTVDQMIEQFTHINMPNGKKNAS